MYHSLQARATIKLIRASSISSALRPILSAVPLHARKHNSDQQVRHYDGAERSSRGPRGWSRMRRHSPDCRWLLGDNSTHSVPRDRLCPGCQAEDGNIVDVSSGKMAWEKQIQEFHNLTMADVKAMEIFVNKNAYEVLFGRSEARLKGIVPDLRKLLKVTADVRGISDGELKCEKVEKEIRAALEIQEPPRRSPRLEKLSLTASRAAVKEQRELRQELLRRKKENEASDPWSTYANNNGNVTEESGKFRYDPITMRLVPDKSEPASTPESTISGEQYPRKVNVEQASTDFPPATLSLKSSTSTSLAEDLLNVRGKLERSYAEARRTIPMISRELNRTTSKSESNDMLASAWRKEKSKLQQIDIRQASTHSGIGSDVVADESKSSLELAWTAEKSQKQTTSSSPHYIGKPSSHRSHEAQMTYLSLLTKDKPLRHMRGYELGTHRANLLASWRPKTEPKPETEKPQSTRKLDEEVTKHKMAFAAFEDKSRLKAAASADGVPPPTSPKKPKPSAKDDEAKLQQQEQANSLVSDIREIYEESYGVIDVNHRQGAVANAAKTEKPASSTIDPSPASKASPTLGSALDDYESKAGKVYSYTFSGSSASAKAYEEEMKNRSVSDAMWDSMDPSLSRVRESEPATTNDSAPEGAYDDYEAKTGGYAFVAGQDSLDKALKNRGVSDAMWTDTDPNLVRPRDEIDPSSTGSAAAMKSAAPTPAAQSSQSSTSPVKPVSLTTAPVISSTYRLLAYDPETQTISAATTNSSTSPSPAERSLTVTEAISRLGEPAKFIKYLSTIQDEGYEIVSAQKHLLVLKLVGPGQVAAKKVEAAKVLSDMSAGRLMIDPVDGTMKPAAGVEAVARNVAAAPIVSACGEDSTTPTNSTASEDTSKSSPPTTSAQNQRTMQRTEPVFSGDRLKPRPQPWTPSEVRLLLDLRQQGKKASVISATTGRPIKEVTALIDMAKAGGNRDESIAAALNLRGENADGTIGALKKENSREKRKRVAEVKSISTDSSTTETSTGSAANMREASRYPSSFLHSTRTYFPSETLAARATGANGGSSNGSSSSSANTSSSAKPRRGPVKRAALLALQIATGCYVIGVLSEQLREYREDSAASRTSAQGFSSAAAVKESTKDVGPPKMDMHRTEEVPNEYVRAAFGDDLDREERARNDAKGGVPAAIKTRVAVAATSASPAAAGFEAEDGGEMYEPDFTAASIASTSAAEGEVWRPEEKLGALEGAFALGAGVAAAICVLLGGFGGN